MTADVALSAISQTFGTFRALDGIDLSFAASEFVVLLGPSGCGKSTLLSILGGFLTPTSGTVLIGGRDMDGVAPRHRPTTTMFQDYALFPHMTLRDNVGFGLRMKGMGRAARHAKADDMLDLVGLRDKAARKPHELSGGQRQRVALARALAVDPDVLLLDEPLGALDLKLRRQMQDELKAIQRKVGTTFVHVTHDQEEAMAIADRIVVMNHGKVEDFGTPEEIYMHPKTLFTANFMGDMNCIPAGLIATDTNAIHGVRPENVGLAGDVSLGPARLESTAFFGTYHRCHFRSEDDRKTFYVAHLQLGDLPPVDTTVPLFASRIVALKESA
ncbi:ABC transporter ATP-binding protein [Loktanella sp. DJP18]|uniref:ABC transporter ATP-binding protein n=1 Tax=Loktanella sp. DJP18 TaxID=3409788 RepID=UPI003BB6F7CE